MNSAWAVALERFWNSPSFPMWLTFAAAGFSALIVLITLLRASKSLANGALTVLALLAIGVAVTAVLHGGAGGGGGADGRAAQPVNTALPALSCIDDLAGEAVLTACEKSLFGSAESAAAAVSYAASQLNRLTELGDASVADKSMSPQLQRLRRAVERDRYGLIAQVLLTRDRCKPTACPAFRALTDSHQIVANMDEHVYDSLIARYAAAWNAPPAPAPAPGPLAALPPTVPTGKPTNAEFPTSASIPPVSIMTPEPAASARAQASAAPAASPSASTSDAARLLSPRPTASVAPVPSAVKKQAAAKPAKPAPVKPAPAAAAPDAPAAAAADNE